MCTISYYPTEKGFILTQNRDESPARKAIGLKSMNGIMFPEDESSSGTWIGTDSKGRAICLMNGAFEPHELKDKPLTSRGTLIPKLLTEHEPLEQIMSLDLSEIEPFTLVLAGESSLHCMRWDGKMKALETLDEQLPQFWSSAMLYPQKWQERRKLWFMSWLNGREDVSSRDLRWFHSHGGEGDVANDLIMNRGNVRTTSITQVSVGKKQTVMRFTDLSTCLVEEKKLPLNLHLASSLP